MVRRGGKEHRGKRRIIFGQQGRRRTEEEKGTIFGEGKCLEKENSFFFLWRRRRTEKENIENIWRREVVFCGGEEERRKIWRIFGKENSFFCGGEEERRRKGRKLLGEEKEN